MPIPEREQQHGQRIVEGMENHDDIERIGANIDESQHQPHHEGVDDSRGIEMDHAEKNGRKEKAVGRTAFGTGGVEQNTPAEKLLGNRRHDHRKQQRLPAPSEKIGDFGQQLEQRLEQAVANAQYERAAKLRDELRTLVRSQLAARRAQRTVSLTRQDVAAVVAERTGIPVGRLRQSDRERLLSLRQTLSQRIIGQQAAVDAVSAAVLRGRTGLADAGRPAASFLLIGPTGVGKTELCKQIAQVVYGSQDALIRVDMSEYMEPNSVSRLLGAPPGYVGYDAGGTLTEKVRRRPYCVVLFDELEKAHRDITGILLQLLGDGILTDSLGRTVSFKNTIVVMTSNLTGPQTGKPGLGFTPDCADIRAQTILREAFSPEFLGRIDCIASFRPLAAEDLARIAALQLRELAERLKRQNVALEFAPELPEHLGALCANEPGGARSLRRRLQTEIEGPAAELLLRDPSVRTLRAVWRQARVVVEAPERCF